MILYGAPVREEIKEELKERIKKLGKSPVLAIVQVGGREDSNIYIKQKQKFGEEIGAKVKLIKMEPASTEVIAGEVEKLNKDKNVDGIIVQLPLPAGFDAEKVLNSVKKEKDADGLVSKAAFDTIPATARGVMALLDYYKIPIKGKKAVVIGQSILAGRPISRELEKKGAEVVRCDINTKNIPEISRGCDILVSAVGKAELVTKEFVNERQTIIDVGINKVEAKILGDIKFEEVEPLVAAITPVPGGIGPLTVACLFENLLDLCYS